MKTIKHTIAAIVFFSAITLLGTAQAQINLLEPPQVADTNPLLRTTGPNTVGKGHLQLSGAATWYSLSRDREEYMAVPINGSHTDSIHDTYRDLGGGLTLRYGLGNRFELMAGLSGAYTRYHYTFSSGEFSDTLPMLNPVLGVKMLIYEGGLGWVPQVSASLVYSHQLVRYSNYGWDTPGGGKSVMLGFQFRNHLGSRWMLDYGLSYAFGKDRPLGVNTVYVRQSDKPFQFNIMARWLATDKLMVSFGMENVGGTAEVLWQATPNLQIKAQGGLAAGIGFRQGILETNALVGFNWMLR